ncbi:MAG TPA: potassium channel family protein [Burkholderiales bacterium]
MPSGRARGRHGGIPKVAFERARRKVVSAFAQRCVYLFAALLLLLVLVPFLEDSSRGRIALNAINILILFAAAVAVSDSRTCFTLALLLGASSVACQVASFAFWEPQLLLLSRGFGAALYFLTLSYLLAYVLRREVLTLDKLYGAASVFIMLGVLWGYFYSIVLLFYPGSLAAGGTPLETSRVSELLYFSFTVLTSTGFGDITPVHPVARMLCVLQQVVGILFVAILIARLAGTYPPVDRR